MYSFFHEKNGAWDFAQPIVPTQTGRTKSTTTTTTPSPIPTTARVTIVNGKKFRLRNNNNNNTKSTSLVPTSTTTTSTTMAPNVTKMISNSTPPKVAPSSSSSNITEDENQKDKLLLPSLKLSCPDNNDSTSCLILQYINQYKTTHPADGDPNKGAWKSRFDDIFWGKKKYKKHVFLYFFFIYCWYISVYSFICLIIGFSRIIFELNSHTFLIDPLWLNLMAYFIIFFLFFTQFWWNLVKF